MSCLLEGSGNTMDFGTQCSVEAVKPPKDGRVFRKRKLQTVAKGL